VSTPAGEAHEAPVGIGADRVPVASRDPRELAWEALGRVYDPELCMDVVSLGLVYGVGKEDDRLVVEMTLTTPGCPASESLPDMARAAIADAVGDAVEVDVRVVWEPPWSPAMMSDDAQGALGFRSR
jgi:metal-sulfur cluster biosynthetic enzyme